MSYEELTYELEDWEMCELMESIKEFEVPAGLKTRFLSVSGLNIITYTSENRGSIKLTLAPESSIVTGEIDDVDSTCFISKQNGDEYRGWIIPQDVHEEIDVLPKIYQSLWVDNPENYSDSDVIRDSEYIYEFPNGDFHQALQDHNPVERLDEPVYFKSVEYMSGEFPKMYLLETVDGDLWYLRERSGTILLYDGLGYENIMFSAHVGSDNPGTHLKVNEVQNIVFSVDYLNLIDDYSNEVSQEAKDKFRR